MENSLICTCTVYCTVCTTSIAYTSRIPGVAFNICQHLKIKNLTLMCAKHTSRARSPLCAKHTSRVQMDEKNNQECKNNESHTFTIKISMKIVFIGVWPIILAVVCGGDILSFHIFEALNDNFEA